MTSQEAFVTRLRRHRERQRMSIDDIARQTRIKREQLEAFEEADLSTWPKGIYARAWVRAYADCVGLDQDDTVNEFCRLFPHGDRRTATTVQEIAVAVDQPSTFVDEFQGSERPDRRRRATDPPLQESGLKDQLTRLTRSVRALRPTGSGAATK
jgi:transcriptional regulator with XRE-family HTH domain